MSTITNIGQCKAKMSSAGWVLFCQLKKADVLAPFDPATCPDDEETMLTKHELLSYEYLSDRKEVGSSRYWLFAFGPTASYSEATVIRAGDADHAKECGLKVALRELGSHPGTYHVEEILTLPKKTGLYSILLPEAKIMIDTHWERRDAVCNHWDKVIQEGSCNPVRLRQQEGVAEHERLFGSGRRTNAHPRMR